MGVVYTVRTRLQEIFDKRPYIKYKCSMNKDKRFELRLSRQELDALRRMADARGITCSELLAAYIQSKAKRENKWLERK